MTQQKEKKTVVPHVERILKYNHHGLFGMDHKTVKSSQ